jgi:uncharacterized membrane protein YeaQ/YmgE (transglycosylase-associated protein family)
MDPCSIVRWLIFGLLVGAIARVIWPRGESMGCLLTALVGIVGSVVGGTITFLLTGGQYAPANWIMSVVGAILFLWACGTATNRRLPP